MGPIMTRRQEAHQVGFGAWATAMLIANQEALSGEGDDIVAAGLAAQ